MNVVHGQILPLREGPESSSPEWCTDQQCSWKDARHWHDEAEPGNHTVWTWHGELKQRPPAAPASDHYRARGGIEPIDFIESNNLSFDEGSIVKYVSRWKFKNGAEDLRKARWYIDRLIAKAEADVAVVEGRCNERA